METASFFDNGEHRLNNAVMNDPGSSNGSGRKIRVSDRDSFAISARQAKRILESTTDSVLVLDNEGRVVYANPQAEPVLKRSRFDLIGGKLWEEYPEMVGTLFHQKYRDAVEHRTVQDFEGFYPPLDMWLAVRAYPYEDGLWVYFRDITTTKRVEDALRKSAETQSNLLRLLTSAQEAERRRISMELHDGPLQLLGVSLLTLERAIKRSEQRGDELAARELLSLQEVLQETVYEMRTVLADLSHEVLSAYGLAMALQNQAERFSEVTGMEVIVHNHVTHRLSAEAEMLLYRLAQEALANARKHSQATRVVIEFERTGSRILLTIRDNGIGFDIIQAFNKHEDGKSLGLKSMRHRIEAIGGSMHITSHPGEGTSVSFSYHLSA